LAVCKYHRDRPGIGVCMRCRAVICRACCTRVEGINYCHACLKKLSRPARAAAGGGLSTAVAFLSLVVTWLIFVGVFFGLQGRLAP